MKFKKLMSLATGVVITTSLFLTDYGSESTTKSRKDSEKTANLIWYTIGSEPRDL